MHLALEADKIGSKNATFDFDGPVDTSPSEPTVIETYRRIIGRQISGRWMPARTFTFDTSYSAALRIVTHHDPTNQDQVPAFPAGLLPDQHWQLHPALVLPRGELSVSRF